jgi:hypothetical protein
MAGAVAFVNLVSAHRHELLLLQRPPGVEHQAGAQHNSSTRSSAARQAVCIQAYRCPAPGLIPYTGKPIKGISERVYGTARYRRTALAWQDKQANPARHQQENTWDSEHTPGEYWYSCSLSLRGCWPDSSCLCCRPDRRRKAHAIECPPPALPKSPACRCGSSSSSSSNGGGCHAHAGRSLQVCTLQSQVCGVWAATEDGSKSKQGTRLHEGSKRHPT